MDDPLNSCLITEKSLMQRTVRAGLTALVASAFALVPAATFGQTKPATGKAAAVTPPKPTAVEIAKRNEVLASVNNDKITRANLIQLLSQNPVAPGMEKFAYTTAVDMLINTRLLAQFLTESRVKIDPADVDKVIDEERKKGTESGTSLEQMLAESNLTLDQVRKQIMETLQWGKYIDDVATDKSLDEYMKANPDVFNGTVVRASHIQINADEDATPAAKDEAKKKLATIKKEILSGKIGFADAANKYSEDPTNKEQPSGGDLKAFQRKGRFPEGFLAAAFALKKSEISDPVQTEYGVHLIQVTDRREGKMPTLEQVKEKAKDLYARDRQEAIVAEMKKKAKIDIKAMPADFFAAPVAAPATTDAKAKAATPAAKP